MPASLNAAILAAAVPLPPLTIAPGVAHAASRRRGCPGDESGHRLLAVLLDPLGRFLLGGAADFADHDDAVSFGVVVEHLDDIEVRSAVDRVAANAHAGGLADAAAGQLPDRLIGQRAAARNDADVSLFMNVAGRDADAAAAVGVLALAGRDHAGTIGPDQPGLPPFRMACLTLTISLTGMPSVMQTIKSSTGVGRFQNGVRRKRRRDENRRDRRARFAGRVGHSVENRNFCGGDVRRPGRPCRA